MSNINELTAKLKASLTRNRHNWSDSVMRICNHCGQWEMTVIGNDAMTICASCCDAEYASDLASNLELATEALEAAQSRIAELEARTLTVKLPHWSGYTCSGEGAMLDACVRSLESQGFTVQIEGE